MNAVPASIDRATPITITRDVDDAAIALFLAQSDDATPFHDSLWLSAIAEATDNRAYRLTASDSDGKVVGYLPLVHVRSRLFGDALVSSAFGVGGGILADDTPIAAALAQSARDLASELDVGTIELRGGVRPNSGWNTENETYAGFVTALAQDDEAQLLAIPRKQRAEVRKSLKGDLWVRTGRDAIDREQHYAVYAQSVRNLGTPVFPRALFDAVLDRFGGDADILTVLDGATPVASVLSLYHRGNVMPYWGGGTVEARHLRANERMYYELMLHARSKGCTAFDFGRSKTGTGPYAYKKNWGFEPEPLTYYAWHADHDAARSVNPNDPKYRLQVALWKKLPLPIANAIGPMVSRGLG